MTYNVETRTQQDTPQDIAKLLADSFSEKDNEWDSVFGHVDQARCGHMEGVLRAIAAGRVTYGQRILHDDAMALILSASQLLEENDSTMSEIETEAAQGAIATLTSLVRIAGHYGLCCESQPLCDNRAFSRRRH